MLLRFRRLEFATYLCWFLKFTFTLRKSRHRYVFKIYLSLFFCYLIALVNENLKLYMPLQNMLLQTIKVQKLAICIHIPLIIMALNVSLNIWHLCRWFIQAKASLFYKYFNEIPSFQIWYVPLNIWHLDELFKNFIHAKEDSFLYISMMN